ncbi:unnamed protein product [Effrenium voratum]|nr:unnamed protein product [Effrenium voratum]
MTLLNATTVCDFVAVHMRDLPDAPLSIGSQLQAEEITGGNLNYAFVVRDDQGRCVFVKQAPDFIKVIGPEAKLTRQRMRLEVEVFQEWARGAEIARYLPRIWKFDEDAMAFIMDFLGSHQLLQKSLFEGQAEAGLSGALGKCMALMHARTHCSKLEPLESKRLAEKYENRLLRDIQLEYVFSKCYREDARATALRNDEAFMKEVDEMKGIYNGRDRQNFALCHGDLHAGSIMVDSASASVKIIDPEFAVFGPPGLDVGSLMSTYVMAYCFHKAQGNSCSCDMVRAAEAIWSAYAADMQAAGIAADLIQCIEQEALGFLGCEVVRTALGLAFERSLRLEDPELKALAEEKAMWLGVHCIRHRGQGMKTLTAALAGFDAAIEVRSYIDHHELCFTWPCFSPRARACLFACTLRWIPG